MKTVTKVIIATVVVGGVAAIGIIASKRAGNTGVEVRTEAVAARDLVASVTASGQIEPRTKVDVSADVTGRIVRMAVKEGDWVEKGQFLLQIDPEQPLAAVQRSEAALASARAQEAQARANALNAKRVYERQLQIRRTTPALVSDEALEQAKTQMEVNEALHEAARYSVEQAQATLRDARQSLARTTIDAPMTGRVTRLNVEEGEVAIMGTLNRDAATLLTISDMTVLETTVRVVEISNSSVNRTAGAATGDQAVDFEVRIQLENPPEETRPDFSATAKIVTDMRSQALSIPIIALTVRENEALADRDTTIRVGAGQPQRQVGERDVEGVFVVGADNKVTFRPVKVGIAGERHFEVLDGLQAGETIVAGTYQAIRDLKDGATVRPVDEQAAKAKGSDA